MGLSLVEQKITIITMSKYTKENPLRVFEAFAGYGSQHMAFERIKQQIPGFDFKVVGISEIDKYALQAYEAAHGDCPNYGDISKIDWSEVPDFDFFTYSSPCFVSGTLVLTDKGYKKIEEISSEDSVLTHTNHFRKVVAPMANSFVGNLYRINAMAFDTLVCTPEHPFYVRKRYKKWDNPNRRWQRLFEKPSWVAARDLTKDHYLGVAINQNESYPEWNGVEDNRWGHHRNVNTLSKKFRWLAFWYIMGRYVGDGWKKTSNSGNGIIICCGGRNEEELVKALEGCGFNYSKIEERRVRKYLICSNELYAFVDRYGYYAHGKRIDAETMNLPRPLLGWFLQGYFDADGSIVGDCYKATSVSKELIYGIGQCVAKVYQVPYRIYHTARKSKTAIEGREVNQRDSYQIVFKKKRGAQDKSFYEGGCIWFPIKSKITEYAECPVFNMEVEEDNSYTANGGIVHNCQDFSNAGLQRGGEEGSGTRSSLLWECRRAIEEKRPKYLLLENVKALVSKKFAPTFLAWVQTLESLGYTSYYKVLNATEFGVPQNRERIFCLSIHGEHKPFKFADPIPLDTKLKDVLEPEVNDKYVLSDKSIEGFLKHNENHEEKGTGFI